jgi:hypothetical protein
VALLLEAVADPYHASAQERVWTRDVITRIGDLARVENGRTAGHRGVFGIAFHLDAPPRPLSWEEQSGVQSDLVLNTAPLARKLASAINHLGRGAHADSGLPNIRHPAYLALLKRLNLLWGGAMRRLSARRVPPKPLPCQASLGFYSIHEQLDQRPDDVPEPKMTGCVLINESIGGAALKLRDTSSPLLIGSLIYLVQGKASRSLGLVRWFRQGKSGITTLGLRFLIGQPSLATLISADGSNSYPAMLMRQEPVQAANPHYLVVIPSVHLDPSGQLEMQCDGKRYWVTLEERLSGSADVELYRCTVDGKASL